MCQPGPKSPSGGGRPRRWEVGANRLQEQEPKGKGQREKEAAAADRVDQRYLDHLVERWS